MSTHNGAIPVVEESIDVAKREVVTGRVVVRTETDLIDEMMHVELQHDSVEVERVPINREVDVAPQVRTEGDVTIIPVVEEIVVLEKRLLLKEEIRLTRRVKTEPVEMPVALRKQRAVIERLDTTNTKD